MGKKQKQVGVYKVFWLGLARSKQVFSRVYFNGEFPKRQKAMNWCRNHPGRVYFIEHPDGTAEEYNPYPDDGLAGGLGKVDRVKV